MLLAPVPGELVDPIISSTVSPTQAQRCTSDISVAQFKSLKGKMDAFNPNATTVEPYMNASSGFRADLYSSRGTLMTHAESIEWFKSFLSTVPCMNRASPSRLSAPPLQRACLLRCAKPF